MPRRKRLAFDEPKYGTLYEVKSTYEYELSLNDYSDEAEKEIPSAGITDVEFMSANR